METIDKLLQYEIPCAPPVILTPNPTSTPEQSIPVPKQFPMNVPIIIPAMPTVPVQVQKVPIDIPTRTPIQVQRMPRKFPGRTTIPSRKTFPPRPVIPILITWRHEPGLWQTRAVLLDQLVTQDHLNHLYHPVTFQCETYEKLKLQHPKRWITSMYNELGCLASGVGDRMISGTYTIF